ncbi:ArsR/SmtB family transcription factor, partial [Streptomyces regalis]|uniref:ArsR/SmtB family transcription factor n=1 Tax=Streptomyces regalis TaxID=68262 RepID=UPI0007C7AA86
LRLQIVTLLAKEMLCTTHLVEETGARQTNLSNHLRVLREAGVVETEPCGRYTYYRLRPDVITALAGQFADLAESARTAADNKRACP